MQNSLKIQKYLPYILISPAFAWLSVLVLLPLIILLYYSFCERTLLGTVLPVYNLDSYLKFFSIPYLSCFWRSFVLASVTSIICLVICLPLSIYLAFYASAKYKNLLLILTTLPMWVSFLLRIYGWMSILRHNGLLDSLVKLIFHFKLISILYSSWAILLGMVYNYIPYMILPLYATISKINKSYIEAALDLGANPLQILFKIILPLSKTGILVGLIMIFMPSLGDYVTPDLMGGAKELYLGNLIQNQFLLVRDWPFGATISIILIGFIALILVFFAQNKQFTKYEI